MAQRSVEMLIGRPITDEQFRRTFLAYPEATLLGLRKRGLDLSPIEIAALAGTNAAVWERAAEALDPRLQKVSRTPRHQDPDG